MSEGSSFHIAGSFVDRSLTRSSFGRALFSRLFSAEKYLKAGLGPFGLLRGSFLFALRTLASLFVPVLPRLYPAAAAAAAAAADPVDPTDLAAVNSVDGGDRSVEDGEWSCSGTT